MKIKKMDDKPKRTDYQNLESAKEFSEKWMISLYRKKLNFFVLVLTDAGTPKGCAKYNTMTNEGNS